MKYRRFGKTEIMMPVFSCGGMRYHQSWDDISESEVEQAGQKNLEATIHRAFELGITHIETARGYGSSEMQLGKVLPQLPRDEIVVQTKIAPSESIEKFEQDLEISFANLKLDYVDLLSLHGMPNNKEQLELGLMCTDKVLLKWQKEGRIRHIGIAGHGSNDYFEQAINTALFSYINIHYYYIKQDCVDAVDLAGQKDMGVFIISPNDKGGILYRPSEKLKKLTAPLTPMQFNDLFCLAHPSVHTLSIGAAKPSDFDEHIAILDKIEHAIELTSPIATRLDVAIDEAMGNGWLKNYAMSLPTYETTYNSINIPVILWVYALAKGLDMVEFAKMRYNSLETQEHWFPGTRARSFSNEDIANNIENSPFKEKIPQILREAHKWFNDDNTIES